MNKRPVWTAAEDEIIRTCYAAGRTVNQTVEHLHKNGFKRGVQAIYSRRSHLGITNGRGAASSPVEPSAAQTVEPTSRLSDLAEQYDKGLGRIKAFNARIADEQMHLSRVAEAITGLIGEPT